MKILRALLAQAIDYAGLFPPAKLAMESAVRNYALYQEGEHSWALGRFIVPVARLSEFERTLITTSSWGDNHWRISALVDPENLDQEVAAIFGFNKRQRAVIDTIEIKASTVDQVRGISRRVPSLLTTYVEVPSDSDATSLIAAIRTSGLCAKVRTGGIIPSAFPVSRNLAGFIHACSSAGVRFKATAGLHHPVRGAHRLTYEPDSPTGTMYGFLNMFVASCVAHSGGSIGDIAAALEEESVTDFRVDEDGIAWSKYRFDLAKISSVREELVGAFGSCSFIEPINDLKSLQLL